MEREIDNLNFEDEDDYQIIEEKTKSLIKNLDNENKITTNINLVNDRISKGSKKNDSSQFIIPELKQKESKKGSDKIQNISVKQPEESK